MTNDSGPPADPARAMFDADAASRGFCIELLTAGEDSAVARMTVTAPWSTATASPTETTSRPR
ncbi:hypothetical protein M2163_000165 [Streptomyces sp. SAI-135]|nr:hypothetical protein [Streptomyces sp. SAI-090]MDH6554943.1 hypothetical protein [Streptomyces sp. SAI-041]MDH6613057.1 hypothetical protein [Streptomyces sp. SAI-135]